MSGNKSDDDASDVRNSSVARKTNKNIRWRKSVTNKIWWSNKLKLKLEAFVQTWQEITQPTPPEDTEKVKLLENENSDLRLSGIDEGINEEYISKLLSAYETQSNDEATSEENYKDRYRKKIVDLLDVTYDDSGDPSQFFFSREDANAVLHDFDTDQVHKRWKKSRCCKEWDPVIGRYRYWRTEHKGYKTFVAFLVIGLGALILYATMSYQVRNRHVHNYYDEEIQKSKNEYIRYETSDLKIEIQEEECTLNFISSPSADITTIPAGFFSVPGFLGVFDGSNNDDKKNNAVYSLRTSYSDNLKGEVGDNTTIREYTIGKKQGYVATQESYCILNVLLHENSGIKNTKIEIYLSKNAKLDILCNHVNKTQGRMIDLKIASGLGTDDSIPSLTGKVNECEFKQVDIQTTHVALQFSKFTIKNLNIYANRGWVDIYREKGEPITLYSNTKIKKCIKGHSIINESATNTFFVNTNSNSADLITANIQIEDGAVHVFSLQRTNDTATSKNRNYNVYSDRFNNNMSNIENKTKITKSSVSAMKTLLQMEHPMLQIGYIDVRAPGTTTVTFFLSHEMVLRLRPVFFAAVSVTMMQALRKNIKIVFSETECISNSMVDACTRTGGNSYICNFPFIEKKKEQNVTLLDDLYIAELTKTQEKEFQLFHQNRYTEIQDYLRNTFLTPLLADSENTKWMEKADFNSLIFAGQNHAGPGMFKLFAWPYDAEENRFIYNKSFTPSLLNLLLIFLSGGITIVLLTFFIGTLENIASTLEKELIASTLFQDKEFKYDTQLLGHRGKISMFKYSKEIFDYKGKGILSVKSFFCKGLTSQHYRRWKICKCLCKLCDYVYANLCKCKKKKNAAEYKKISMLYLVDGKLNKEEEYEKPYYKCVVCCGLTKVVWSSCKFDTDRHETTVGDFVTPNTRVSQKLNDLLEWEDYVEEMRQKEAEKEKEEEKEQTHSRKGRRVVPSDQQSTKHSEGDNSGNQVLPRLKENELINYVEMHTASKRLMNRAALVASYTDLLYFIEVMFPQTESSSNPSAPETLYSEMDHDTWFIELACLASQIAAPALIIIPITVFACAWVGFESYYYESLPRTYTYEMNTYYNHSYPVVMPAVMRGWTGYVRFTIPFIALASTVIIYMTIEMYNS